MVMAAGLGTRLRPLTWEVPKPVVPVVNRPVIEHILRLLRRHEITEAICNLHWFPETIREPLARFRLASGSSPNSCMSLSERDCSTSMSGAWLHAVKISIRTIASLFKIRADSKLIPSSVS